jgi:hypothetical protein
LLEERMNGKKKTEDTRKTTSSPVRPWLVDVVIEDLR